MLDALATVKTPAVFRHLYADCIWSLPAKEPTIYLTFDDGPQPMVTDFVLDELKQYNASATFFCIGENVKKNPELFQRLIAEKHAVGNHTYNHLNGWKTNNNMYYENIELCRNELATFATTYKGKHLFRPPYGKLSPTQYGNLKAKYSIVMWDVLSFDFDVNIEKEEVLENVLKNTKSGSIVVLHDSIKAEAKIRFALPIILRHFSDKGYKFAAIC